MLRRLIDEGEIIPAGYGVAWDDYMRRQIVCYPLGLNVLICWARQIHIWLMHGHLSPNMRLCDWYAQGFEAGKQAAKKAD